MTEITLKIKATAGGGSYDVVLQKESTISLLKGLVSEKANVPIEQIRLIYKGKELHSC